MSSRRKENGSFIYVFKLCLLRWSAGVSSCPHWEQASTLPCGDKCPLLLLWSSMQTSRHIVVVFLIFIHKKKIPFAWQILNQKRLGNSTLRSCQQSTSEVNLIDGKRKRKAGSGGREGKKNKKGETQVVSSNQHELQVGLLCFISWFCCQIFVPHYWTWTGVSLFF